jgi:hypothetical protein
VSRSDHQALQFYDIIFQQTLQYISLDIEIYFVLSSDEWLATHVDCPVHVADFGICEGQTFLPLLKLLIGKYMYFNLACTDQFYGRF